MRLIAHRGNIWGPSPDRENTVPYVEEALEAGYDVEVDVWSDGEGFYMGHDPLPMHHNLVSRDFLEHPGLWIHAKSERTLYALSNNLFLHTFAGDRDPFVLTSHGFIWSITDQNLTPKSILMHAGNLQGLAVPKCFGVCSDYIGALRGLV